MPEILSRASISLRLDCRVRVNDSEFAQAIVELVQKKYCPPLGESRFAEGRTRPEWLDLLTTFPT
jgi:hypothetical protein